LVLSWAARCAEVEYHLTISEKLIAPAGKQVRALVINDSIPGPTLRFRVGDWARIRVTNGLPTEETSLHWHGLLVPNEQDGVPYVTTPPIKAGASHLFEFELTHPGTYWYHSHTGLQEQRGVYGSIVVEPSEADPDPPDREYVVVLSDWTNEHPDEVMRTLVRGDEYYALRKGNMQSLWGAHKAGALKDYLEREWTRMPPMDISDVAYDAFWINGQPRIELAGTAGERIKLRIINAAGSTYFYIHSAAGPLTIVAADGPRVQPVEVNRLLIGMAETYDVIVTVPGDGRYEVRATTQDGSGQASLFLGTGAERLAEEIPKPDLYRMEWMAAALEANEKPLDAPKSARPQAPYRKLKSTTPTELPADAPLRELELRLTGDMQRYIWSLNGKTLMQESTIPVKHGEVLRMKLINDTMMHHPMHLHGHFFRLLNGQGAYSPLKHTVDVPPMGTQTIEFEANEVGDWLFHCHLLYHMKAGMTRVISYTDQGENHRPTLDTKHMNPWRFNLGGTVQNNFTEGHAGWMNARNNVGIDWEHGLDRHEEYEIDLIWKRYFNPNFSTIAGYRFTNSPGSRDRGFGGVLYRLPFMVESMLTVDTEGALRPGLGKSFQLTDRLSLINEVEYDTHSHWEWSSALEYRYNKRFSITTGYHSKFGLGGGIHFRW
jgi:FtsP/CotA-like multicopper oxidase with cupredoxin domain